MSSRPRETSAPRRAGIRERAAAALAGAYFDLSYRLLVGSKAGQRLLQLTASGDEPVHGYFTAEDRAVLLAALAPVAGERLLDLGSGIGGIALEMHRLAGVEIVGIDVSASAVAAASHRAEREGVGGAVRFVQGNLARPLRINATGAYAIDSLMFLPDPARVLRAVGEELGPGRRIFATLLVFGADGGNRLVRSLRRAGMRVGRLDDVTTALVASSKGRANVARGLSRETTITARGRLAMALVLAEEYLVQVLVGHGCAGRWRIVTWHE
ncbi:MAG TPA: class I SAM-dependent methyltransferase [Thermomicrobiaceae bacterium]|nr:class I SAM-dependent methyltransferase [Thermomicrobiaceae bacterium]